MIAKEEGALSKRTGSSMENAITISDIAKVLGVSETTVSRALNNSSLVNEGTKNEIVRVAERLNYRPNLIAKSFVRRKTQSIGVIITNIANPFFAEVFKGIEKVAKQGGYHLLLGISEDDIEEEKRYVQDFLERRVDGILLVPVHKKYNDLEHIYALKREKVPFVLVSRNLEKIDTDWVMTDLRKGSYELVKYLVRLGHRRILFIVGPKEVTHSKYRIQGYRDGLKESKLNFDEELIFEGKLNTFEEGYNIGKEILADFCKAFDAIITINDVVALGILRAAKELRVRIPEDFSLAGYDDVIFAAIAEIPLTTVAQPTMKIGEKSMEVLLERIKNNSVSKGYQHIFLQPRLVLRNSCKSRSVNVGEKANK